jgi:hypothetical protein
MENTQRMKVAIMHAGQDNDAITSYLGKSLVSDRTKSLEQVNQLIEHGQISPEDILDYANRLTEELYLLDTAADYMSPEQAHQLFMGIYQNIPVDMIITDIDTELTEDITQEIIKTSDMVLIVLEQSIDVAKKLKKWRSTHYYDCIDEVGEFFVINRYNKDVMMKKDFAKAASVNEKFTETIDYNTFLLKLANEGQLMKIMPAIMNHQLRVFGLSTDLKRLIARVFQNLNISFTDWDTAQQKKAAAKAAKGSKQTAIKRKH